MGPRTHAAWLCSLVFDGARAFEGVVPDLDLHCARVNNSAGKLFLKATVSTERWIELAQEGVRKFDKDATLYIRPMYWGEREGPWIQAPDPESTRWCLTIYEAPMRTPTGFSITLSPYRRPTIETMPVDAKAGCLYPNNARALMEAHSRGFDNAVVCDALGNVAELASSMSSWSKTELYLPPSPMARFLDGITRQRVIKLLRESGVSVVEKSLTYADFQSVDEIFQLAITLRWFPSHVLTTVLFRLAPCSRKARELYWEFAHRKAPVALWRRTLVVTG